MAPRNFSFTLHCISKDLVPFDLPVVFTIGPYDPSQDMERFLLYASKMSAMSSQELHDVVLGCIHGASGPSGNETSCEWWLLHKVKHCHSHGCWEGGLCKCLYMHAPVSAIITHAQHAVLV
jgi:hypothetical protein